MVDPPHPLGILIDELAEPLPAQGPISVFIHHNTLHTLEHLPFEEAVELAAARLGCEPFLAESRYRDKLASGRILAADVERALHEQLGARGAEDVAGVASRFALWRAVVLHGIPEAAGRELAWILDETTALSRFRTDVPAGARAASAGLAEPDARPDVEALAVHRLWNACLEAVSRADPPPAPSTKMPVRHRDWLLAVHGLDTDSWFHPSLIRFLGGYLDQGLAQWPMPGRNRGIHGCFLEVYGTLLATQCGQWARSLPRLVDDDRRTGRDALGSIAHSLDRLGVADDERAAYLGAELLALRGWAGIVRQIEERPDRVPARDLTVTLRGYLAVRLLFERAALDEAAQRVGGGRPVAALRSWLRSQWERPAAPTVPERAWPLFHVAQLCGVDASIVEQWNAPRVAGIEAELRELDGICRRRILQQAFERAIRARLYDALTQHASRPLPARRPSRRSSASTSGRNRSAATWRRWSRPARRSARPDSSTWRCTTRASATRTRGRSAPCRSAPSTTSPRSISTRSGRRAGRAACSAARPGSSATTCTWAAGRPCAAPC